MCKLFIAAGSLSQTQVLAILKATNSTFAKSQRDGFGFVAYGDSGVARGRYLSPDAYPGFGFKVPSFCKSVNIEEGTIPKVTKALVIHGRTSTNRVMVENVHPFKYGSLYLAHNGVLRWQGEGPCPKAANDCDSEQFLSWFFANKEDWTKTEANWSGYGVFGVINTTTRKLTVAKCGSGNLDWAGNKDINLFSTHGADIRSIAEKAKLKVSHPLTVNRNTLIQIDLRKMSAKVGAWAGFGSGQRDAMWHRSMGTSPMAERVRFIPSTKSKFDGITVPRDGDMFPDWKPKSLQVDDTISEL